MDNLGLILRKTVFSLLLHLALKRIMAAMGRVSQRIHFEAIIGCLTFQTFNCILQETRPKLSEFSVAEELGGFAFSFQLFLSVEERAALPSGIGSFVVKEERYESETI
jgi:hypothetical protein